MALNKVVYFVNPVAAQNKVVGAVTTGAGSTIYTAPGVGTAYVRVKSFTVTLLVKSGGANTDYVQMTLKIGTGQYNFGLQSSGTIGLITTSTVSSETAGFEPGFLQAADTITTVMTSVVAGGATYSASVSITLEDYFV